MFPSLGRAPRWRGGVRPGNHHVAQSGGGGASSIGGGGLDDQEFPPLLEAGWDGSRLRLGSGGGRYSQKQEPLYRRGEWTLHGNYSVVSIVTSDTRLARQIPRGMAMGLSEISLAATPAGCQHGVRMQPPLCVSWRHPCHADCARPGDRSFRPALPPPPDGRESARECQHVRWTTA